MSSILICQVYINYRYKLDVGILLKRSENKLFGQKTKSVKWYNSLIIKHCNCFWDHNFFLVEFKSLVANHFCIPIAINNPIKACFSNKQKYIFCLQFKNSNPDFNRIFKMIGVQNQLPIRFCTVASNQNQKCYQNSPS